MAPGGGESEYSGVPPSDDPPPGYTEMGWAITPPALTEFLTRLRDTYQPPAIMITENGLSASGSPQDPERIAYLEAHIAAVGQAIEEGVPVSGYFVWSFLDNLEWTLGYAQRFGIVWVDFETLERTPKDSFWWYRDWIARVASR